MKSIQSAVGEPRMNEERTQGQNLPLVQKDQKLLTTFKRGSPGQSLIENVKV